MRTLICGGTVIDPASRVNSKLNLLIENGKVSDVTRGAPAADSYIDAGGKMVCPGFIDIHMHEDPVEPDGSLYSDPQRSIFHCMLRMGVTTALGGNCGINLYDPAAYLDLIDRDGAAVNVAMLAGHAYFRERAGAADRYAPTTPEQRRQMASGIAGALERGCLGVSYGVRYTPGMDANELLETAGPCRAGGRLIAAHIRSDAEEVFDSARELLDAGRRLGIPVQVSHIGSMAGFGQMERFLAMLDEYRLGGLDLACDCYPYYAFSTHLGSATYDEGWLERYGCGYDVVELCEGKYKGLRCTRESFEEVRRDDPDCLTVCHVMKSSDVDMAFGHPNVMLGSDGLLDRGQGHPRAAGAFPRLFAEFVRKGKLSLYDAIDMVTARPAERLGLESKGRLSVGADADIVIFDPERIADRASFSEPLLPPAGIDRVLIAGQTAAVNCQVVNSGLGRAVRK